jgi:hypothetical protein
VAEIEVIGGMVAKWPSRHEEQSCNTDLKEKWCILGGKAIDGFLPGKEDKLGGMQRDPYDNVNVKWEAIEDGQFRRDGSPQHQRMVFSKPACSSKDKRPQ